MEMQEAYCGEEYWSEIDLKTFFAILALMRPDVKQADIAKDLGITPATLSRIINGTYGDGRMRWEWIPALKPYLMSIDTQKFSDAWHTIENLHDYYAGQERHEIVCQIILNKKGHIWSNNNNWKKNDSMLFYGSNGQVWHMYDLLDQSSPARQIKEIVSRYKGYIDFDTQTQFTFLCYNEDIFDKAEEYLATVLEDSYLSKRGVEFSAIWVDMDQKIFKREYHLYPAE